MSHSYTNLIYHIVFATKNREPLIDASLREPLFDKLGQLIVDEGGITLAVNGMADHAHLLAKLRPDHAVADVVGAIEARATGWVHRKRPDLAAFFWQTGYGAFTVSHSQVQVVLRYIQEQEKHHADRPFDQELRSLLRRNGFDVDDTFYWE
jgi:putative transposase